MLSKNRAGPSRTEPITIHAFQDRLTVSDDDHEPSPGDLISIQAAIPHAVRAVEASAFLLTVRWLPDDASDPAAMKV